MFPSSTTPDSIATAELDDELIICMRVWVWVVTRKRGCGWHT